MFTKFFFYLAPKIPIVSFYFKKYRKYKHELRFLRNKVASLNIENELLKNRNKELELKFDFAESLRMTTFSYAFHEIISEITQNSDNKFCPEKMIILAKKKEEELIKEIGIKNL